MLAVDLVAGDRMVEGTWSKQGFNVRNRQVFETIYCLINHPGRLLIGRGSGYQLILIIN